MGAAKDGNRFSVLSEENGETRKGVPLEDVTNQPKGGGGLRRGGMFGGERNRGRANPKDYGSALRHGEGRSNDGGVASGVKGKEQWGGGEPSESKGLFKEKPSNSDVHLKKEVNCDFKGSGMLVDDEDEQEDDYEVEEGEIVEDLMQEVVRK